MKKIFVAIPTYSGLINSKLVEQLLNMQKSQEYEVEVMCVKGGPVDYVRNVMVEKFLKSGFDYMLMIDDDIIPPADILDMAKHEKDITAGMCYIWYGKRRGINGNLFRLDSTNPVSYKLIDTGKAVEKRGLVEVDATGTGCMMIHRKVFDMIEKPYFKTDMDESLSKIKLSNDLYFCHKAKQKNIRVYVDTDKVCGQLHPVDLREVAESINALKK